MYSNKSWSIVAQGMFTLREIFPLSLVDSRAAEFEREPDSLLNW
jgi:hypothetical protein